MTRSRLAAASALVVLATGASGAAGQVCADRRPVRLQAGAGTMVVSSTPYGAVTGSLVRDRLALEIGLAATGAGQAFGKAGAAFTVRSGEASHSCVALRASHGRLGTNPRRASLQVTEIGPVLGHLFRVVQEDYGAVWQYFVLGPVVGRAEYRGEGERGGINPGSWSGGLLAGTGVILSGADFEVVLGGEFVSMHEPYALRLAVQLRVPTTWGARGSGEGGR